MTGNLLAMLLWIQEKQCNRGPWIFYDLGCSHSKLNGWISIDNHNILPEKTLVELMLLIYALHSNNIQWVLFPGLMILFFYTALKPIASMSSPHTVWWSFSFTLLSNREYDVVAELQVWWSFSFTLLSNAYATLKRYKSVWWSFSFTLLSNTGATIIYSVSIALL